MKTLVEDLLPASVLLKQGIYLQTCAHIELVAWRIVQMVNGVDTSSTADIERYLKLKLDTRGIVSQLRNAALRCHAPIGLRLMLLARRLGEGLSNRNMAAHGAWRQHPSGKVEVEHYSRAKDKTFHYVSERFGTRRIDAAVEDADLLLREAVNLHDLFRREKRGYLQFIAESPDTNQKAADQSIHSARPAWRAKRPLANQRLARVSFNLMISTALCGALATLSY
jgi:hypothetical protein